MSYILRQLRRSTVQNILARIVLFGIMWIIYVSYFTEKPVPPTLPPPPVDPLAGAHKHKVVILPPQIENEELGEDIRDSPLGNVIFQNGPDDSKYLKIKDAAAKAMKKTAAHAKTILLTMAYSQDLEMLFNFLEHTLKLEIPTFVLCTDGATYDLIEAQQEYYTNAVLFYEPAIAETKNVYKPKVTRIEAVKYNITLQLLKLGHAMLISDADVTWVKDPYAFFKCKGCDLEVQQGFYGLSPGVAFLRPTKASQGLITEVMQITMQRPASREQTIFTEVVKRLSAGKKLKMGILPEEQFPNGQKWFYQHYQEAFYNTDIVCYHNNFLKDKTYKIFRAREMGLWTQETDAYYSNPESMYLSYENPMPQFKGGEEKALDNALKIGKILDRKVILPTFTCPAGKYQCQYRPGNCACSLAEIININVFDRNHKNEYREHLFLQHPKVPTSVNTSLSEVYLIENKDIINAKPLYYGVNKVFRPQNVMTGATSDDIRNWFGVFTNMSVLRFGSLYGTFRLY